MRTKPSPKEMPWSRRPETRRTRRKSIPLAGKSLMFWGAMGPTLLFLATWTVFPFFYTFLRSFYDWRPMMGQSAFVGLENYSWAFGEPLFWKSVRNTALYAVADVGVGCLISMILAVMINSVKRFAAFYRISYFLPMVMSVVALSLVWQFILQPRFGILNTTIQSAALAAHLPPPPEIGWLTRPQWALISIIMMTLWMGLGFRLIIFLAGLQGIPAEVYEAARIDGAGPVAQFRHITMPLLVPTSTVVLVVGTIDSLQMFAPSFVMTRGGPMNATLTIVLLLYQRAFREFLFGQAAAVSFILFAAIMVLTLLQNALLKPRWEY